MKKYVSTDPGIMGGAPVIAGTRIPMARIVFLLKEGYTVEAIQADYPWVPLKTLRKAVEELVTRLSSSEDAAKILQA